MKFLHTSDLHLKEKEEKRIAVLKWLIQEAARLKIEYFIIAGDLFDSDTDATILHNRVKQLLEHAAFKFIFVPGNHDKNSFGSEYDYGKNVIQLTTEPFQIIESDNIIICGVPYQHKKFSECIKNMPDQVDILITHGTLYDKSFIISSFDEIEAEYLPIYPSNLHNKARYVALGHFHAKMFQTQYNGVKVVYPGAPIGLDTKCEGKRYFSVIDIDKQRLKINHHIVEIAPYWQKKEFFVFPGNEEAVLNNIQKYLFGLKDSNIMPNIIINGFIKESDRSFKAKIEKLKKEFQDKFSKINMNDEGSQSWQTIMQNEIVQNFIAKSQGLEDTLRKKVFELVFPIFSKLLK